MQRPLIRRRFRQGGLRCLRGRGNRLHGVGLQVVEADFRPGQVRRLEVLRRGSPAADRGRQPHAPETVRDGRRRQVRLEERRAAQEGQRVGPDPRGLLRQPGFRGRRHDQGRLRQGLRGVGQPDGGFHGQGAGDRPGAGGDRQDARRVRLCGRQFRLDVCRAGRNPGEEVSCLRADTKKEVGIHAHNNQQLAFANSIEAIIHGANRVDASMAGLGRGPAIAPWNS